MHIHRNSTKHARGHIPACLSQVHIHSCVHTTCTCSHTQSPCLLQVRTPAGGHTGPPPPCMHINTRGHKINPFSARVHTLQQVHPCAPAHSWPLSSLCTYTCAQPPTRIHVCILIGAHTPVCIHPFPMCAQVYTRAAPCAHKCTRNLGPCPPCAHRCTHPRPLSVCAHVHTALAPLPRARNAAARRQSLGLHPRSARAHTRARAAHPLGAKRGPPGGRRRRRRRAPKARKRARRRAAGAGLPPTSPRRARHAARRPLGRVSPAPGALQGRTPGRSARRDRPRVRVRVSAPACPFPRPRVCPRVFARRPSARCGGQGAGEGRGPGRGADTRGAHRSPSPFPAACARLSGFSRLLPPVLGAAVGGSQVTRLWGRGPGSPAGPAGGLPAEQRRRRLHPAGIGFGPGAQGLGSRVRGGGADPDLACPTAGSGAREALAARRPRPSDRPEAGPRKPTCQSYRPAEWARGSSQRDPGAPWGALLRRDRGAASRRWQGVPSCALGARAQAGSQARPGAVPESLCGLRGGRGSAGSGTGHPGVGCIFVHLDDFQKSQVWVFVFSQLRFEDGVWV